MANYIARKTLRLVALLVFVSLVTFTLIELSPIDPINAYLNAADTVSAAQKAEIAAYFGLDQSPVERYIQWIGNLLQGDLGTSLTYRVPVMEVIASKFANSLALMLSAFVLSGVMGLGLGIAMGQHKTADKVLRPICLTLSSTPTFFIGMIFLIVFAVKLDWFPIGFSVPMGTLTENVSLGETVYHLVLPVVALSFASFSHLALHTREKVVEILDSDYVLLAQTRGFTRSQILRRHVLRNVILPFITLQFASLSEIFGGSILAETVFSYPGLGSVMVDAGLSGDVPLLLGVTLFSCAFVFVGNFTANILYGLIDPKIRLGAKQ
ncbi:ABC transporter permease [Bengtsoniella intestinalis]|uniref:ABC transporter permease n=1 Tax=Bengtsoniella intestinalis TaxID=3073143 RepID=UPI00391F9B94